jgi:hypothetical protein
MFTSGFATQVIAPVGQGQPGFVSVPVHWVATVIAAHPAAWNVPFAAIQLLLGAGLLVRSTARVALLASIAWALGVWYFGEGLSGMASGQASMITGAPGSALLYAVLAVAAWPRADATREAPAPWLRVAWAVVWISGAILQLLPKQDSGRAVASAITAATGSGPAWLIHVTAAAGDWATHHGLATIVVLVAAQLVIGVGALLPATRVPAVVLGLALTLDFWVLGQHLGMLYSGQATDPNTAAPLALMGIALVSGRDRREQQPKAAPSPVGQQATAGF